MRFIQKLAKIGLKRELMELRDIYEYLKKYEPENKKLRAYESVIENKFGYISRGTYKRCLDMYTGMLLFEISERSCGSDDKHSNSLLKGIINFSRTIRVSKDLWGCIYEEKEQNVSSQRNMTEAEKKEEEEFYQLIEDIKEGKKI